MEKAKEKENVVPMKKNNENNDGKPNGKKGKGKKIITTLLVIVALALAITAAWFINSLRYVAVSNGKIDGSVTTSGAKVSGKIIEIKVAVGDKVKKGDILAVIDNKNQNYSVQQLTAVVAMKQAKLDDLTAGTRIEQIQQIEAQVRAAKEQWNLLSTGSRPEQKKQAVAALNMAKTSAASAQLSFNNIKKIYDEAKTLYDMGEMSGTDFDAAKLKMDTAEKQLKSANFQIDSASAQLALLNNGTAVQSVAAAKDNYQAIKAQLDMAKSGATKPTIAMAIADLKQSTVQLDQAKNTLDDYNLRATADGTVIKISFVLGDTAIPGSSAVSLVDFDQLIAKVGIDERYISKLKVGQEADLTVASFPGVKFKGTVKEIGLATELTLDPFSTSGTTGSSSDDNQVVPVKVKIDTQGKSILPGVTVDGEIKVK